MRETHSFGIPGKITGGMKKINPYLLKPIKFAGKRALSSFLKQDKATKAAISFLFVAGLLAAAVGARRHYLRRQRSGEKRQLRYTAALFAAAVSLGAAAALYRYRAHLREDDLLEAAAARAGSSFQASLRNIGAPQVVRRFLVPLAAATAVALAVFYLSLARGNAGKASGSRVAEAVPDFVRRGGSSDENGKTKS